MKPTGKEPTYTATNNEGKIVYANRPNGNLIGELPLGAYINESDQGTLNRKDGGDPFEEAKFYLPSGRTVTIKRD